MADLSPALAGPLPMAEAKAVEQIPREDALPGGTAYEPKLDGYRIGLARIGDEARLWSRRGTNLTSRFPILVAAATRMLPQGLVLDGELVVYVDGMPDFGALQSRETAQRPATFMAFDILAANGIDIRKLPWSKRRKNLETLASAWEPPIELGMVTYDLDEAREWFDVLGELGVEGLVAKGQSTRYLPGTSSGWLKIRHRATLEVIVGAVTGSLARPEAVIAGRFRGKVLEIIGRTVQLKDAQAKDLAAVLKPAGPTHPWPDEISSYRWAGKDNKVRLVKVQPKVIIEVAADVALQGVPVRTLSPAANELLVTLRSGKYAVGGSIG